MKKTILTFAALLLTTTAAWADHQIKIQVNGMVCDFCAQSVWKVFKDYDAVDDVKIDLDTGTVTVLLKDGQGLTDEQLDKAIVYAGYDLVGIHRHDG